jgi:hypothetical protein
MDIHDRTYADSTMHGLRKAPPAVDFGRRAGDYPRDRGVEYSHEARRGRGRSGGATAALEPGAVAELDAELERMPRERHREQPLRVTQRAYALIARAPA